MGWGAVSLRNAAFLSALGRLLAFFLGFGRLFMSITSTGTSLIPRECSRGSHSITLAFDFVRRRLTAFTVSRLFFGIEK
jgi:amino acid transporter